MVGAALTGRTAGTTIPDMSDTKTRTKRDDDTDTTDQQPAGSTEQASADQTQQVDPEPTRSDIDASPAVTYAGTGRTEPIKLRPETHGNHDRGPQGDI